MADKQTKKNLFHVLTNIYKMQNHGGTELSHNPRQEGDVSHTPVARAAAAMAGMHTPVRAPSRRYACHTFIFITALICVYAHMTEIGARIHGGQPTANPCITYVFPCIM
jgi:hypothetical protein